MPEGPEHFTAAPRGQVRMGLLENGLDELSLAVEHLGGEATPRNLKRAVKSLATGLELVLKDRLRRHNWRELFAVVARADEGKLRRGDFLSAGPGVVIDRLRAAGVEIPESQRKRLDALRQRRNRVEHFELIDTADAIMASTAGCLSFVLDFVIDELDVATLSAAETELFEQVREALPALAAYVSARGADVAAQLDAASATTTVVVCPSCDQEALVLDYDAVCLFCRYKADPFRAADDYITSVLGLSEYVEVKQGGEWPRLMCPDCENETLVDTGGDGDARYICFACTLTWGDGSIDRCLRCGAPHEADGEVSVCRGCLASVADRE